MRRILFIRFGNLVNCSRSLSGIYYALLLELARENRVEVFTFDLPYIGNENIVVHKFDNLLTKLTRRVISLFWQKGERRYFMELLFDLWIKLKIAGHFDSVFIDRPICPLTLRRVKKEGAKVVSVASVPHPLYNYALVYNEAHRLGLKSHSTYLNKKWINVIMDSLTMIDKLLILSHKNSYYYHSFRTFLPESKLISLRNYFRLSLCRDKNGSINELKKDKIVFMHVSHMNLIKGVQYLFEAWEGLKPDLREKAQLVLAGHIDGDIRGLVRGRYPSVRNVRIIGWVEDLNSVFMNADVFISPSISDGGPQTIIEALSCGIPVIASDHCGNSDLIVDGKNGFVYRYNDIDELRERIEFCIKNPDFFKRRTVLETLNRLSTQDFLNEVATYIVN